MGMWPAADTEMGVNECMIMLDLHASVHGAPASLQWPAKAYRRSIRSPPLGSNKWSIICSVMTAVSMQCLTSCCKVGCSETAGAVNVSCACDVNSMEHAPWDLRDSYPDCRYLRLFQMTHGITA